MSPAQFHASQHHPDTGPDSKTKQGQNSYRQGNQNRHQTNNKGYGVIAKSDSSFSFAANYNYLPRNSISFESK
jgi:hypothetical protein